MYGTDSVATYYGETESDDRQTIVNRFQDPDSPLKYFVGQPRTGGYGLTLTEAKTVIYYSNNFCLLYTSPSPRDGLLSRMPSSA